MGGINREHQTSTTKGSLSLIRTLISIHPEEKTLHSSINHETAGLLPSVATIKQILYHKRIPISIRP